MSFADGDLESDEEVDLYNQGYREAMSHDNRHNLQSLGQDANTKAGGGAITEEGDEQTETDELFNDIEAAVNKQNGWSREAVRPLIAAWSRQQTARVLDELRMELHLYTAAHDRYMRDEALKLIAELRVGLEGRK